MSLGGIIGPLAAIGGAVGSAASNGFARPSIGGGFGNAYEKAGVSPVVAGAYQAMEPAQRTGPLRPQQAPMGLQQYMQGAMAPQAAMQKAWAQRQAQQPMADAYRYMSDNNRMASNRQAAAQEFGAAMQPQVAEIQAQSSLADSVTGLQGVLAQANAQMQTDPLNSLASMYGSNMNAVAGQNIAEMQNRARMAGLQQILGAINPMIGGMAAGPAAPPNINTNYGAGVSWGQ